MRKKSTYLYFLALIAIFVVSAFALNISFIKVAFLSVLAILKNPWVYASAAACAFIFMGTKRYWLINIGCAIICSFAIQFIIGGGIGVYTILYRTLAFLTVVYALNLIKIIFTK